MPVIYSRNFASGAQQYLALGGNSYARPLSIGANWTRLRIGLLCNLQAPINNSALDIRTPSLCIGVSHDIGSDISVKSPTHCFGWAWTNTPDNAGSNLTYAAGSSGNSYWNMAAGNLYCYFKYENGAATRSTVGSVDRYLPTNNPAGTARRGILILDISKTARVSGTIYQGVTCGAVAHMSLDITSSDLYKALETGASATSPGTYPVIQGTALTGQPIGYGAGNPLAFNETTYGSLNTVFVYWNHITIPFCLYELGVYLVG